MRVAHRPPVPLVELTAGDYHACDKTGAGDVKCWGRSSDNQTNVASAVGASGSGGR